MTKLIKAEFFRITHTRGIVIAVALVSIDCYLSVFFSAPDAGRYAGMDGIFSMFTQMGTLVLPLALGILCAATIVSGYSNRTSYYEIMDGANPHKIICGRLLTNCPIAMLLAFVPVVLMVLICSCFYDPATIDLPLSTLLIGVITLHIAVSAILFAMIFQSGIATAMVPLRYMAIEQIGYTVLLSLLPDSASTLKDISEWFPSLQIMQLGGIDPSPELIFKIIASFLIESVVLYIVAYVVYKKKKFK